MWIAPSVTLLVEPEGPWVVWSTIFLTGRYARSGFQGCSIPGMGYGRATSLGDYSHPRAYDFPQGCRRAGSRLSKGFFADAPEDDAPRSHTVFLERVGS